MPDRPTARAVGGLSFGLLLGVVAGWVAGLLRVRTLEPPAARPPVAPAPGSVP